MMESSASTPSGTPSQPGPSVEYFVEQIVQRRPFWFRYEVRDFHGDRSELHARILKILEIQTSAKVRAHVGMVLLCLGHHAGAETLLDALRGTDEAARW